MKKKNSHKYSGVPQKDIATSFFLIILAIPKSVKLTFPFSSIKTFSGFKSL